MFARRFGMLVGLILMVGMMGCETDLYVPCQLDPNSTSREQAECASQDGVSCSVDNFTQCESRVCARFEGSEAFCTRQCASDADCGAGQCRDYDIIQPGAARYCVAPEAL